MIDTTGIIILFGILISISMVLFIIFMILKSRIIKKYYGMSYYEVSKYFQEKSGFPLICRWLHYFEIELLILLIILGNFLLDYFWTKSYNFILYILCIASALIILISNIVMRYKSNKSLPLIWWFKGIK